MADRFPRNLSLSDVWSRSFKDNDYLGQDRSASLNVNIYALGDTTFFAQKLTLAPAANAILTKIDKEDIRPGYYEIQVLWGNVKVQGTNDPALSDLDNFWIGSDGVKFYRLVSLGQQPLSIKGYATFTGTENLEITTQIASTANVLYMAGLAMTRIALL